MKIFKCFALLSLLFTLISCGQDDGAAPGDYLVIFVSSSAVNGNFGGPSQADAICMADASKPAGGKTYKAMLSLWGTRYACTNANCPTGTSESKNWVLKPNQSYVTPSGSIIAKTNGSAIFDGNLTTPFSSSSKKVWTGLRSDWTQWLDEDCNDWTSQNGFNNGARGVSDYLDSRSWSLARDFCDEPGSFYCVEQAN